MGLAHTIHHVRNCRESPPRGPNPTRWRCLGVHSLVGRGGDGCVEHGGVWDGQIRSSRQIQPADTPWAAPMHLCILFVLQLGAKLMMCDTDAILVATHMHSQQVLRRVEWPNCQCRPLVKMHRVWLVSHHGSGRGGRCRTVIEDIRIHGRLYWPIPPTGAPGSDLWCSLQFRGLCSEERVAAVVHGKRQLPFSPCHGDVAAHAVARHVPLRLGERFDTAALRNITLLQDTIGQQSVDCPMPSNGW